MAERKKGKKIIYTVKRGGHREKFDDKKLYGSAYAACLNAHLDEKKSEKIAEMVLKEVKAKLAKGGQEVSSSHLSILVYEALKKHEKDAAFLYSTHLDLS